MSDDPDGDFDRGEAVVGILAELTSIRQALWSINGHLADRGGDGDAPDPTHRCTTCGETFGSAMEAADHGVNAHNAPSAAAARKATVELIDRSEP